jgi:hypothetical protein
MSVLQAGVHVRIVPTLVSKIPGGRREFEIVQVDYSARQAAAMIRFSSTFGIFAFGLNPGGRKVRKITLIVNDQQFVNQYR